jgi:AraC-like DNA-binding protein
MEGGGNIAIGETQYPFRKDHMYMIPAYFEHNFDIDKKEGLQTIEIKFDIEKEEILNEVSQMPLVMPVNSYVVRKNLEMMIEEGQEADIYYSDIANLKLCETLLHLLRAKEQKHITMIGKAMEPSLCSTDDPIFEPVIAFMRNNMHKAITLDMIADIACLEKTYFSKKFKEKYGSSPIHFLNDMRLFKAKELLTYSDMSITQISEQTGFQSIHYFSRFFSQKEGLSPYEFRQKHGRSVYLYFEEEQKVNDTI